MVQIAETERAQQQLNMMPASEYRPMTSQSYDVQNFLPVNLMEPNPQYSRQDRADSSLNKGTVL